MINSRAKGQRAERELCKLLSDELGVEVKRNVDQARSGGADCLDVPGFAIEVKHRQATSVPAWWKQARQQAIKALAEPILFYRKDREAWKAAIATADGGYRLATWEQAIYHMREKLARLYGVYQ